MATDPGSRPPDQAAREREEAPDSSRRDPPLIAIPVDGATGPNSDTQGLASARAAGMRAPAPASKPASTDPDLSGSVRSVVDRFAGQQVPVTVLIDAMLDLHGGQYLSSWPWSPPTWPPDPLMQPVNRWTAELAAIVTAPSVFGRIAILGWCLLDDQVAAAAQASGMLAGIAHGITPAARDFLKPDGRGLLRRRAPLVALTVGELPPTLHLPGVEGAGAVGPLAVAPPPTGSTRTIGRWAAASGSQVIVGQGPTSRPLFPEAATDPVLALGWSRGERLQVMTGLRGLLRIAPDTFDVESHEDWAPASTAMVTPDGIVATPGVDSGNVAWGVPDGVGPVLLPELDQASGALVAVAGGRVAALCDDRLWFREPEGPWAEQVLFDHAATVIAATDDHVLLGNEKGEVQLIPWGHPAREAWQPTSLRVLDGPVRYSVGGSSLAVVASEKEFAVVSGSGLLARWSMAASGPKIDPSGADVPAVQSINGVGLSHEGAIVAVCGYPLGLRFWRIDANPEVRLTSYSADTPEGEDHLGILPTVDALAAIVVARAVQPPLSLGLFGAWGSGKSFFMRRLEHRVGELSQESHDSGRAQASLWAWRNVRQVRFNAWHYASADVWAGMLEQLVRELARPTTGSLDLDPRGELDELERARINRLAGAVEEAHGTEEALREAKDTLAEARESAVKKEEELADAQAAAREVRAKGPLDAIAGTTLTALDSALQAANLPQVTGSLDRTLNDIDEARRSVRRAAGLAKSPGRLRLAVAVLAILAVGVLITFVLQRLDLDLAGAFGILGSMLAAVGVVARWVTSAAGEVQRRVEALDKAEVAARTAVAEVETALAEAEARVVTAEGQLGRAQRKAEQAGLAVAEARQRVAQANPGDLLMEYLEGRNAADDYRGMLGLIGTVRRDLEVISDAVDRNNRQLSQDPDREASDAVNRVVLYIDDLDRCPPPVVVKVLEALSMLLTFPLFVVVVAVDAHWISKSLAAVYPKLLTDGDVTPDNYLEKIFQMPVWLDRPSELAASTMARALLAGPDMPDPGGPERVTPTPGEAPVSGGPVDATRPPLTPRTVTGGQPRDLSLATTPPAAVLLDTSEISAIADLAPLVARTPRALKRYLNTYRVLKALVNSADLSTVRLLLAVATGRPDLGERLLEDISQSAADRTLEDLVQQWPQPDRTWLQESIPPSLDTWPALQCGALQPVAHQVRRFVFHAQNPADLQVADAVLNRRVTIRRRRGPRRTSPSTARHPGSSQ